MFCYPRTQKFPVPLCLFTSSMYTMYSKATTQQELYLEESWKAAIVSSSVEHSLGGEYCAVLRPAKRLSKNVGREVPRNTIRETKNIHSLRGLGLNEGRKRGRVH